ncbi:MAG: hypothetical protein R2854_08180 [Caldilineaceae bacterium]
MTTQSRPKKLISRPALGRHQRSQRAKNPSATAIPMHLHLWSAQRLSRWPQPEPSSSARWWERPITYVDELLADPATRRKAEQVHKARLQRWGARQKDELEQG